MGGIHGRGRREPRMMRGSGTVCDGIVSGGCTRGRGGGACRGGEDVGAGHGLGGGRDRVMSGDRE